MVLDELINLLDQGNFYELPHDVMWKALDEDNIGEGIIVSVKPEKYAVLKIWVIGKT